MIAAWQNLQPREQLIVGLGGAMGALVLVFLLVVEPLTERRDLAQSRLDRLAAEQAWLRTHAEQVAARPERARAADDGSPNGGRSMLAVVDVSARRAGVHDQMRQARPRDDGVVVRFEGVDFQKLMTWLGTLESDEGIVPERLDLSRQSRAGQVNADLQLQYANRHDD